MSRISIKNINTVEEANLWKDAIFVWDTSALCRLYSLTPDTRDKLLAIIAEFKHRFWIPHRAKIEFSRHKGEEQKKQLALYSNKPKFISSNHFVSEFNDYIEKLQHEKYRHPKFDDNNIETLSNLSVEANTLFERIRVTLDNSLKNGKNKLLNEMESDPIGDFIVGLPTGQPIPYNNILQIVKEGTWRYSNKIPPGYMDQESKESIDRYGDLILWKEIIQEARTNTKDVILVIQDLKEDWNASQSNETIIPREELIEEFESETGQHIWMYTISDFISHLCTYVGISKVAQPYDSLDSILRELRLAALSDDCIKIECNECKAIIGYCADDFNFEWHWFGDNDREMGPESVFVTHQEFECPNCGKSIHNFSIYVYQYPIGVINYIDLEVEDCKVLFTPNMDSFIDFPKTEIEEDFEACCRCGEWRSDINENGLCPNCINEFNNSI